MNGWMDDVGHCRDRCGVRVAWVAVRMGHYRLHQVAWVTIDYVLGHYRCDARGRLRGSLRTLTMDEWVDG